MKKFMLLSALTLISMLVMQNCNSNSTDPETKTGTLSILLTDAPAAYDSVIVVFREISAHIDSEWVHVMREPVRVNLLEWSNGETILLASSDVPAGTYTQIRIKIDSAYVGVDGELYELTVPSGSTTGLKFGPQFTILQGSSYELVLDFDAGRSIVVTGPKKNPKGYKLKPHIRVITEAVTGSISGLVTNPKDAPVAFAILDSDTLTSTIVDTATGHFKLSFLPANLYTVSIEDTVGHIFSQSSINVMAGTDNNIGTLTLE